MNHDHGSSPVGAFALTIGAVALVGFGGYFLVRGTVRRFREKSSQTPQVTRSEVPSGVLSPEHQALASRSWATAR